MDDAEKKDLVDGFTPSDEQKHQFQQRIYFGNSQYLSVCPAVAPVTVASCIKLPEGSNIDEELAKLLAQRDT